MSEEVGGKRKRHLKAQFSSFFGGLQSKVILTFLLPTLFTVTAFVWYSSFRLREGLDTELGYRLNGVAQSATAMISSELLMEILPGEEKSRNYRNLRRKLIRLKKATGVSRIYIFDREHRSILDTKATSIGKKYVKLTFERQEIQSVFKGKSRASILFPDRKGNYYKTGFAPLYDGKEVVAAIAAEASASYFQILRTTQRSMLLFSLISLILVVVTGVFFTRWLVSPVKRLVQAAKEIGEGKLTHSIPTLSKDEFGFLAETMEEMRTNVLARDRQMQMMLSGIAHEVRNPLGGMELFSGILREELGADDERVSHVDRIQRELRYLKEVVNSFLDFARPAELNLQEHDWQDFLFELTMLLSADADKTGIHLKLELENAPEKLTFDRRHMHQAFLNLLQNAIQASPRESSVLVKTEKEGDGYLIQIIDKGKGIPEEKLKQIFEPFFTTKEKGTGLGLPLAKKLIESHRGELEVTSEENIGTEVSIWLPCLKSSS